MGDEIRRAEGRNPTGDKPSAHDGATRPAAVSEANWHPERLALDPTHALNPQAVFEANCQFQVQLTIPQQRISPFQKLWASPVPSASVVGKFAIKSPVVLSVAVSRAATLEPFA
jgi:hypothetical protein